MRVAAIRAAYLGVLAFLAVVILALTSTSTAIFALTATTALIMGGSGHPLSPDRDTDEYVDTYMRHAVDAYIVPSLGGPASSYNKVAVITPEQFAQSAHSGDLTLDQSLAEGVIALHTCIEDSGNCDYNTDPDITGSTAPADGDTFVVFGYSQSATIGTLEKRRLAAEYAEGEGPDVSFVFIGNGNRPNGGFLARGPQGYTIPFPLIFGGATFSGPSPTNTQYSTVDIAEQYDSWADLPLNPLNLIAMANWYSSYVHYNYKSDSLTDAGVVYQGTVGDTRYYMISTPILPLLTEIDNLPVIGHPLADTLDAPLRVLVEAGYNRTASPGQPLPWNPLYIPNPIKLAIDFAISIPTGWDNGLQDVLGTRPFGTQRPGPYGVGGSAVTYADLSDITADIDSDSTQNIARITQYIIDSGTVAKSIEAPSKVTVAKENGPTAAVASAPLSTVWQPGDAVKAVSGAIHNAAAIPSNMADQIGTTVSTRADALIRSPRSTDRRLADARREAAASSVARMLDSGRPGASKPSGGRVVDTEPSAGATTPSDPSSSDGKESGPHKKIQKNVERGAEKAEKGRLKHAVTSDR